MAKRATLTDYLRHWQSIAKPSDDPDDVEGRERRRENYEKLANEYYALNLVSIVFSYNSTDFYLEGWGQSFHFCRYPRGIESMLQAMARHEHYMAHRLNLSAGMTFLDVGCGIGGPAKEIAKFTDCKVVGLNNNSYQIEKGREIVEAEDISKTEMELVLGNFLKIPFPGNSFDSVYAMEATVHAPTLVSVYSEIFRVLKPGGRFGVYEWVMNVPAFDPSNTHHVSLRHGIERGNGIACIRTSHEAQDAMKQAGFALVVAEDLAEHNDPLPWWYFFAGDTKFVQEWTDWGRVARMTGPGRVALDMAIRGLEFLGVARKGTAVMAKEMIHGGDCIAEAGRDGLFTPMVFMIGLKPDV
ncbi:S-adenosyl-L-methionine-dependent methyltransferase [Lentithecium fluviatile CBS 122367]|uniref:Sterol 24-C-methyltransferase n=1 Tax=Lentithecium fluviatile CBS 122367 TaxID=1168545 RepID=A0A6G1IQB4_9PLEO|nr:S-adenosyl-L-methionine-dependent methyltransferase [Lentithecium fluviatile CBS 122367]